MKNEVNLVGYIDESLTKINLIEYYIDAGIIPEEFYYNDLRITLSLYSAKRSVDQNALLFGFAYPLIMAFIKENTGEDFTKDMVHAHNMEEIQGLKYKRGTLYGKEIYVLEKGKSSKWTKKEFSEAYNKLQNWWAEKGCIIPDSLTINLDPVEILTDYSPMPHGSLKGTAMKDIEDKYLLELYNNKKRYCSEAVKKYIEDNFYEDLLK
jgi:hypothetical protein